MKESRKALTATISLTLALFSFIILLLYVIYCYAYYDKYLETTYIDNFNNKNYSFVYDKMVGKGDLTFEQFKSIINDLNDKDKLISIYNTYYKDSNYSLDEFLDTYLFENIITSNIKYSYNGKTNLLSRRALFYDEIVLNNNNNSVTLGVFNKISFMVEDNSILRLDGKELDCLNKLCSIDKIYGGIYEISYISNGYEYYGLVNVSKDKQVIDITNLDSLIKVKELDNSFKYGKYLISRCADTSCPSLDSSYLIINQDNTYLSYLYYDGKSVIDNGSYTIQDNMIILESKINKESYFIDGNSLLSSNDKLVYTFSE